MKFKSIIYSFTVFGIFGCSQSLVQQPDSEAEGIRFCVTVDPGSKMTTDADLHSVFEDGDKVGVFAVLSGNNLSASGNYVDNRVLTYSSGEWLLEGDPVYLPEDGSLDIYAYYPYMKDFDPTAYHYDASVKSFDLMSSRALAVSSSTVNLLMEHLFVLLDVNIDGGGNKVSLNNAVASARVNLQTGVQNDNDRKALNLTKSGPNTFRHYIPAQTFTAGKLFQISAGSSQAIYKIANEKILQGGQAYRYNISSPLVDITSFPNCYMMKPGETIQIPVYKAFEIWKSESWSDDAGKASAANATATAAVLTWQDEPGLFTNLSGDQFPLSSDAKVREKKFTVTAAEGKTGNAVVAIRFDGAIRWAIHIWVTDYDPSVAGATETYNGLEFMDRNLGATSAVTTDPASFGCYYQACRPHPFPGPSSVTGTPAMKKIYNAKGEEISVTNGAVWDGGDQAQAVRRIVKDPLLFVTSNGEPYSWLTKDQNAKDSAADFWPSKNNWSKTAYDPCPAGWMLPAYDRGGKSPFEELASSQASSRNKLPKSGRLKFNGSFDTGSASMLWCGDAAGLKTCALYISWDSDKPKELNPNNNYSRSNALPVRCVKETF